MDYKTINTFEKALEVKGETLEQFNERTKAMDVDTVGYEKVKVIAFALNGGKHVKEGYFPWFYNPNRSSVGFSYRDFNYGVGLAFVGARHLMIDSRRARFAGETFPLEYSQYINGTVE